MAARGAAGRSCLQGVLLEAEGMSLRHGEVTVYGSNGEQPEHVRRALGASGWLLAGLQEGVDVSPGRMALEDFVGVGVGCGMDSVGLSDVGLDML